MKYKSIAQRLIVSVLPIIAAFTLLFIILTYVVTKSQMDKTMNGKMEESLNSADLQISGVLNESARISRDLAIFAGAAGEHTADNADEFDIRKTDSEAFLMQMISGYENVMGGGIWYEKDTMSSTYGATAEFYSHYVFYNGTEYKYEHHYSENGGGDFHEEPWYLKLEKGEVHWSNVYYDRVAATLMVTATYAFYDGDDTFRGVTTADMSLGAIRQITSSIKTGETGKAFLLGADGGYISFFEAGKIYSNKMQNDPDAGFAAAGKYLTENKEGQTTFKHNGVKQRVYFKTVQGTDWILAVAIEESEISSTALNSMFILIIVPIIGLVLSGISILFMANRLKRVTAKVNDFAGAGAAGDFDRRITVTETDEFGVMEERLNSMMENMQRMSEHSAKMLDLAQNASRSKSDFLSRMSHEIRTPMNAIIGMTQIAYKTGDANKVKDCLKKIDNASRHLLSLINDILDMSKIEANKLELIFAEFDLNSTLSNIHNFIAVRVEEKQQAFTINADPDIPPCLIGDELRFSQVVTNLLSNAVKFTPAGGKISLDIKQLKKDDKYVDLEISVQDNGIGLTEEQTERLFTAFEQADGSTSRKYGGTGLGLAICKNIVELAGGEIRVESEIKKGSRFIFTAKFLIGVPKDNGKKANCDLSLLKVLAVDDKPETVDYLKHLMSGSSITCDGAADGAEAVERVRKAAAANAPYDIIFMDYLMPGMDGLEASEQIKRISASTIIIMISVLDLHDIGKEFNRIGVEKFLPKPFSPSDVYDALSDIAQDIDKCKVPDAVSDTPADFTGYTVLLAEDVEINREIVYAMLADTGLKIDSAENGKIAVDMFRAAGGKYDLILMDLQMPEMDGLTAAELIRETDKKTPILAMTANAFKEDIDMCTAAGMNGHIAKPVDYEVLVRKMKEFLAAATRSRL